MFYFCVKWCMSSIWPVKKIWTSYVDLNPHKGSGSWRQKSPKTCQINAKNLFKQSRGLFLSYLRKEGPEREKNRLNYLYVNFVLNICFLLSPIFTPWIRIRITTYADQRHWYNHTDLKIEVNNLLKQAARTEIRLRSTMRSDQDQPSFRSQF